MANLFYVTVFILCVVQSQVYVTNAFMDKLIDNIARTTMKLTDAVTSLDASVALTDMGSSLGEAAVKLVSGSKVKNAASYTSFLFFSRESGEENYTELKTGDLDILLSAGFSVSKPTKILIHGWSTNGTDEFPANMTKAFLDAEDVNVISVDWEQCAKSSYLVAFTAVPYVAAYTASFIHFLVLDVGVQLSDIHVVGYSLGAHISGIVGEHVSVGKLPRITGLDPAGPLFTSSTNGSLDASDAEFVDVMHTTAGTLGYADPCGTVDFYPNGGYAPQEGCPTMESYCSHGRAYQFFAESLTSDEFIATQCNSWDSYEKGECADNEKAIMGYHVDQSLRGSFYLETNEESPFAKGA